MMQFVNEEMIKTQKPSAINTDMTKKEDQNAARIIENSSNILSTGVYNEQNVTKLNLIESRADQPGPLINKRENYKKQQMHTTGEITD